MPDPCPRCGGERGDSRWCATCGLDLRPTAPSLPTTEAMEAGDRERAFFDAHPDLLAEHEQRQQATARTRDQHEYQRLASTRPVEFDAYRDLGWRARLARLWVMAVMALSLTSAAFEVAHLGVLGGVSASDYASSIDVEESNARLFTVYIVTFCGYLLSGGFFIAWTWRAYRNITALGAQHPRFGSGWAVGGWFVPILSLWRPKQIVDDIWRTSDPAAPAFLRRPNWSEVALPGLLTAWWTFFILSQVLDRMSGRISGDSATLGADRFGTTVALAASLSTVAAGVCAIRVVARISERQRERAEALARLPARA
jgi:hypothetical protein